MGNEDKMMKMVEKWKIIHKILRLNIKKKKKINK